MTPSASHYLHPHLHQHHPFILLLIICLQVYLSDESSSSFSRRFPGWTSRIGDPLIQDNPGNNRRWSQPSSTFHANHGRRHYQPSFQVAPKYNPSQGYWPKKVTPKYLPPTFNTFRPLRPKWTPPITNATSTLSPTSPTQSPSTSSPPTRSPKKRKRKPKSKWPTNTGPSTSTGSGVSDPPTDPPKKYGFRGSRKDEDDVKGQLMRLESRQKDLKSLEKDLEVVNFRIRSVILEVRRKKMYFYDAILLKTMQYNDHQMKRLADMATRIEGVKSGLTSKNPWKVKSTVKRMKTTDHVLEESDDVMKSVRDKMTQMNGIIGEMASVNEIFF